MKTNLKDNIWIEGFDDFIEQWTRYQELAQITESTIVPLYAGKTSVMPREIAKKYFDYGYDDLELHYTSINEAIKESCNQEYCIIYKI